MRLAMVDLKRGIMLRASLSSRVHVKASTRMEVRDDASSFIWSRHAATSWSVFDSRLAVLSSGSMEGAAVSSSALTRFGGEGPLIGDCAGSSSRWRLPIVGVCGSAAGVDVDGGVGAAALDARRTGFGFGLVAGLFFGDFGVCGELAM